MSGGRIALLVIGSLLALLGLGMAAGGGALLWLHETQRDADGYYTSSAERYASAGYAVSSQEIDLGTEDAGWADDLGDLARVRIVARGAGPGSRPLFVGIGPREAVDAYLAGVARSEVQEVDLDPFRARYADIPGVRTPAPPASQGFWVARAGGPGARSIEWDVRGGSWVLVIMNATPARGVAADVQFGVRIEVLLPIAVGLLVVGLVLLAAGATMVVVGARRGAGHTPTAALDPDAPPVGGITDEDRRDVP